MSIVAVKSKYQIVIPAKVREQVGIKVGDLLEAKVERGKITFTPKSLVDREIAEGLEDIRKGRTYGPYDSPEEMIQALRSVTRNRGTRTRKHK